MATFVRAAAEAVSDRRRNRPDWILLVTMTLLAIFGLVMIYSATRSDGSVSMERQMIFVAIGVVIYLVASMIDYREYRALTPYVYGVVLVMLVAVFFFPERNGARRWIDLPLLDLQPAELAKVVVILALASILAPHSREDDRPELTWPK